MICNSKYREATQLMTVKCRRAARNRSSEGQRAACSVHRAAGE